MKKYFCPICGNSLDEEFSIGNICPCCGNESEFHDDISVEYLKRSNKLPIPSGINISDYRDFEILPKKIAWKILRQKWINDGCPWVLNLKNERPTNWNLEMAKAQLLNIKVDITSSDL